MRATAQKRHVETISTQFISPSGYKIISRDDASYPQRLIHVLGAKAPRHFYYLGNLSLLATKAVGFCGSRKASNKGLETAQDCAGQIARKGITVISGNAAGVDYQAHHAALKTGGCTILVLPEGVEHFRIKRELKNVWDWERVLVISHYEPKAPWQAYRAMERNSIIVALSDAMIVIEAGEKGGTLEAGKSTLHLKRPLYVAVYEDMANAPGNDELLKKGAIKLRKSRNTLKANLTNLLAQIENETAISNAIHPTPQSSFL